MESLNSSLMSLFLVLLLSSSWAASADTHEDFLQCLSSHSRNSNSNSVPTFFYTPNNRSYESILLSPALNERYRSSNNLRPFVIVTPSRKSQIQAAIYCSRNHGLLVRVRSGGHDFEGLSYTSNVPFVIMDLRNMQSISIDRQNNTAWVQAGATLGELYYNIAQESRTLAFPAGVCPTVGVGGQFSGGGYGMMSRKFGLAADNIIDAQLIDANGRILDRESMGEEHFWAIRGGGGTSFGIVVAWKIRLVLVPEIVTVFTVNRTLEQNATELVHRWQYIADKIDENLLLRLFISSTNSTRHGKRTIQARFTSLFLGGADRLLLLMQKRFPELGLVKEDCIEMSWIDSALYFPGFSSDNSVDVLLNRTPSANYQVSFFKGKSDYVRKPISRKGLEGIWRWLYTKEGQNTDLQFSPYGGRLSEIPEFEIPFPHRAGNIYMIEYVVSWEEASDSKRYLNWTRRLYRYMAPHVSKFPRYAYVNYRDLDLGENSKGNTSYAKASAWATRYFGRNFNRLVHVKTVVDPTNFFRNEQSIPIKSS